MDATPRFRVSRRLPIVASRSSIAPGLARLAALAALAGSSALGGCVSAPAPASGRSVRLAEFARPGAAPSSPGRIDIGPAAAIADADPATGPVTGPQAVPGARPLASPERSLEPGPGEDPAGGAGEGAGEGAAPAALEPNTRLIVDSMVGQVNGRPVFANEFFEPIEEQLIAISRQSNLRDFIVKSSQIVGEELKHVVRNALILAEAEASLTADERKGLIASGRWLLERVTARVGGGSRLETQRQLRESQDVTIEEYMQDLEDRRLIQKIYLEKISPEMIVTWRDVEREYARRYDEFNPPATIKIARIRLLTDGNAERIEEIRRRLESGEAFLEVAASLNQPGGGVWQSFEVKGGLLSEVEIRDETIKQKLGELAAAGDSTGPFEVGVTTWWLHIADLDQPPARDLYDGDVQRMLTEYIRRSRGSEAENRYVNSLMDEGIYDELDAMADRLMAIAIARYAR